MTLIFRYSGAAPAAVSLTTPQQATVFMHGKALEKIDGKPEDRPESTVVPIPGVTGKVLLIYRQLTFD